MNLIIDSMETFIFLKIQLIKSMNLTIDSVKFRIDSMNLMIDFWSVENFVLLKFCVKCLDDLVIAKSTAKYETWVRFPGWAMCYWAFPTGIPQ